MRAALLVLALLVAPIVAWSEPLPEPVRGPTLICFKYSTFALEADEEIVDFTGGLEEMAIELRSPAGVLTIDEGEILAARGVGRPLWSENGTSVFRLRHRGEYTIVGRPFFAPDRDTTLVVLKGTMLTGRAADAQIYRRFRVVDTHTQSCTHTYTYGWEFQDLGPSH